MNTGVGQYNFKLVVNPNGNLNFYMGNEKKWLLIFDTRNFYDVEIYLMTAVYEVGRATVTVEKGSSTIKWELTHDNPVFKG